MDRKELSEAVADIIQAASCIGYATSGNERNSHKEALSNGMKRFNAALDANNTKEPDAWVIRYKDKAAPRGYWLSGAFTVQEFAQLHCDALAKQNLKPELVPVHFMEQP